MYEVQTNILFSNKQVLLSGVEIMTADNYCPTEEISVVSRSIVLRIILTQRML